jgi:hypothetical protein
MICIYVTFFFLTENQSMNLLEKREDFCHMFFATTSYKRGNSFTLTMRHKHPTTFMDRKELKPLAR